MKLAKRIIPILLLVALCFSLVACADVNILGVSTPTTPLAVSDGSAVSDFEIPVAYRNDYFGYQCVLPDDWYVLNDDEMNQILGITNDTLGENEETDVIRESFESGVTLMDFYALSGDGIVTINIVLEKARPLAIIASEQRVLDASTPLLVASVERMGATDIKHSTGRVDFLGEEHVALFVQGDYQGTLVYETIFVIKNGFYISNIAAGGTDQAAVQECLQYFQVID